jgi:hypothetical protein
MKRRDVFKTIAAVGVTALGGFSWMEWEAWHKNPDFQYLDDQQTLLAALAETIIPTTDTPGAGYCNVDKFIIGMIRDCASHHDALSFIDGLKNLAQYSYDTYGKKYEDCTIPERVHILRHFEEKGRPMNGIWGKIQKRYVGESFFSVLKDYTVLGFCTSERGMTTSFAYIPVPGAYHGCQPLQTGQRGWATR